jgi:hypothetical protein
MTLFYHVIERPLLHSSPSGQAISALSLLTALKGMDPEWNAPNIFVTVALKETQMPNNASVSSIT